jgi:peptide deformylase
MNGGNKMALREIRKIGDEILRKKSRAVDKIDERVKQLIEDMEETMYYAKGVGLAAPQVGVLKRIVVIDVGEGLVKLINPEIIYYEGAQSDDEGCLSVPDVRDTVERPQSVKVKALNENGESVIIDGSDFFARALCHEIDHLDGILFVDRVEKTKE